MFGKGENLSINQLLISHYNLVTLKKFWNHQTCFYFIFTPLHIHCGVWCFKIIKLVCLLRRAFAHCFSQVALYALHLTICEKPNVHLIVACHPLGRCLSHVVILMCHPNKCLCPVFDFPYHFFCGIASLCIVRRKQQVCRVFFLGRCFPLEFHHGMPF